MIVLLVVLIAAILLAALVASGLGGWGGSGPNVIRRRVFVRRSPDVVERRYYGDDRL